MDNKQQIIEGLNTCEPGQKNLFMRMYSPKNLNADIESVVHSIPPKKVSHALKQVRATLEINKLPKQKPAVEPQKKEPPIEERILPEAFDAADDSFYQARDESARNIVGAYDEAEFQFEGKPYHIKWHGYWEKGHWYDWKIYGNSVNIEGTRYI